MGGQGYEVIVLGGGTMGTAAAWELGKRGVRALVLEQFGHVHTKGSHSGKTRVIRHAYAEGPEYVPLVQRADELWLALEAERGQRVLVRTGGLELAAPGYRHARDARASADLHGLPYEWLDPGEANRRWPAFAIPDDWDVLFSPQAGFLLTEPALREMAGAARALGVEIREEEAARSWGADAGGALVRTDRGEYRADRLIVTAGAWTGPLLAELGLPLTVLRKVLWWFAVAEPAHFTRDRFPVFVTDSDAGSIYGFPLDERGAFKIANHTGGEPTTADTVDRTVRPGEGADVVALMRRLFPAATDRVVESAVCLYTMTPDTDFVVDRHPVWPHVVVGAGFSGHGFKFAPAIGEQLVALAVDAGTQPVPRLALARFATLAGA